ncbi:acetylglutamate kinase [Bacillus sp. SB49]|uniref:acetylglutamate kinase n=1 Tax=Bacillus sp. SB49 TaxID=1071080 RepID=UPI0009DC0899|nr:acetylglutamate kinase [Bacillus sp. SB49]QHT48347.1 acetylglutamate kinase [Bacillus sp. SB49]
MTTSKSMQATEHKPVIVVKLGGSMTDQLTDEFYQSFRSVLAHYHCIIVHGGGPAINRMLEQLKIEGEFYNGLRKTTAPTMAVVEMVLGGQVSAQITGSLAAQGISAIGVKGSEADLLTCSFVDEKNLGYVGEVEAVEPGVLNHILEGGYLPVVAPFGKTSDGVTVNVNADMAAGAIARAVGAKKLLYVTDVPGILINGSLLDATTPEEIESMIEDGSIYGGMIPKVKSAVEALSDDLEEVLIVSGETALMEHGTIKGTSISEKRKEKVK